MYYKGKKGYYSPIFLTTVTFTRRNKSYISKLELRTMALKEFRALKEYPRCVWQCALFTSSSFMNISAALRKNTIYAKGSENPFIVATSVFKYVRGVTLGYHIPI